MKIHSLVNSTRIFNNENLDLDAEDHKLFERFKNKVIDFSILISIAGNNVSYHRNNGTKLYYDKYLDSKKISNLIEFANDFSLDSYLDTALKSSFASTLSNTINSSVSKVLHKYRNTKSIQEETCCLIESFGLDANSIDYEDFGVWITYTPVVKEEVLSDVIINLSNDLRSVSIKLRKLFLFFLSVFMSKNGYFDIEEFRNVLEKICKSMSVDVDYIDEFEDYSRELIHAMKEYNLFIEQYNSVQKKITRAEDTIIELINE